MRIILNTCNLWIPQKCRVDTLSKPDGKIIFWQSLRECNGLVSVIRAAICAGTGISGIDGPIIPWAGLVMYASFAQVGKDLILRYSRDELAPANICADVSLLADQEDDLSVAKKALVLLNMGGPDSINAVEPFLYNLFADRDLIQLPLGAVLQKPFARVISHFRAKTVRENYRRIGGKSPLLHWTALQAEKSAALLGEHWHPYVAMRYWKPRADETLLRMRQDGIEQAVVLSMYPHYTSATTGSSVKDFKQAQAQVFPELHCTYIESWHDWPPYLDALAQCVTEGLEQVPEAVAPPLVLFSAHALPQKFIERGDPYQRQVEQTVAGVMERIGALEFEIGYQSRSGPVKWMEPDTRDLIARAGRNKKPLLVVPVAFVSDHIETLEEVDVEFREHAQQYGVPWFERVPALNARDSFIHAVAQLVRARGGF